MGMFGKTPDLKPREIPDEGKFPAVLYLYIDLGSIKDEYKGEVKIKRRIYLCWELVGSKMSDGRPFVVGQEYGVTKSKFDSGFYFPPTSNVFKMLKGWTGASEQECKSAAFLERLIDESFPATITIEHVQGKKVDLEGKPRIYANIESIKPFKGKDKPVRENAPVKYILGADTLDLVPDWLRIKIKDCLENTTGLPAANTMQPDYPEDESVPF